jgi:hypothetical protein
MDFLPNSYEFDGTGNGRKKVETRSLLKTAVAHSNNRPAQKMRFFNMT